MQFDGKYFENEAFKKIQKNSFFSHKSLVCSVHEKFAIKAFAWNNRG